MISPNEFIEAALAMIGGGTVLRTIARGGVFNLPSPCNGLPVSKKLSAKAQIAARSTSGSTSQNSSMRVLLSINCAGQPCAQPFSRFDSGRTFAPRFAADRCNGFIVGVVDHFGTLRAGGSIWIGTYLARRIACHHAVSSGRPARSGFRDDGRSPDSRLNALPCLPGPHWSSGVSRGRSPLTGAGAVAALGLSPYRIPS